MGKPPYAHRPIGPVGAGVPFVPFDAGAPFDAGGLVDAGSPVAEGARQRAPHLRQNRTKAGRPPQILHSSAFQEIQYAHV